MLFRPCGDGTWINARVPQAHRDSNKMVLTREPEGWVVKRTGKGAGSRTLYKPAAEPADDPEQPPLGEWRGCTGNVTCTLTDDEPPSPSETISLEALFADIGYVETGNVAQVNLQMRSTPITDESFAAFEAGLKGMLIRLAQRPYMTLFFRLHIQDASVPAMRHVKKFMSFAQENGWMLDMLIRGIAIVLDARGITGNALQSVVKMVMRLLPAPWPNQIVPSIAKADALIAELAAEEVLVKSEPIREKSAGQVSESELGKTTASRTDLESLGLSTAAPYSDDATPRQRGQDDMSEGLGSPASILEERSARAMEVQVDSVAITNVCGWSCRW